MKALMILVVILVLGYIGFGYSTIYRNKSMINDRVSHYLGFVDENSMDQVKTDLVKDAAELGVVIDPANIRIIYQDTERATGAQRFVKKLATFENKEITIHVTYVDTVLGIKRPQEISRTRIKQIRAVQKPRPEYEELLR